MKFNLSEKVAEQQRASFSMRFCFFSINTRRQRFPEYLDVLSFRYARRLRSHNRRDLRLSQFCRWGRRVSFPVCFTQYSRASISIFSTISRFCFSSFLFFAEWLIKITLLSISSYCCFMLNVVDPKRLVGTN